MPNTVAPSTAIAPINIGISYRFSNDSNTTNLNKLLFKKFVGYKFVIGSLVILLFLTHAIFSQAQAITITAPSTTTKNTYISQSSLIGIQLSQSCIVMEKNHVKSNCLSYFDLKQFDTTNPLWSGQFVNDTWYHRSTAHVKNLWQYYSGKNTVYVDPSTEFTTRAKMIIVQSDNFTWINPDESVGANHTRNEYVNKAVVGCYEARVAPNLNLINQTIQYLKGGCKDPAYYNDKITVRTNDSPFNYNNPYSSLLQKYYLQSMLSGHWLGANHTSGGLGPSDCITHKCNYTDPYKKAGY